MNKIYKYYGCIIILNKTCNLHYIEEIKNRITH